jgi:hypothetical protein
MAMSTPIGLSPAMKPLATWGDRRVHLGGAPAPHHRGGKRAEEEGQRVGEGNHERDAQRRR